MMYLNRWKGERMSASLEISLYIGELKTRFDKFDEIELELKNGKIVKGIIQPFEDTDCFYLNTENGMCCIRPSDIKRYIPN